MNSRVRRVCEEACSMCLVTVGDLLFDEIREFNKKSDFPSIYSLISRILLSLSLSLSLTFFLCVPLTISYIIIVIFSHIDIPCLVVYKTKRLELPQQSNTCSLGTKFKGSSTSTDFSCIPNMASWKKTIATPFKKACTFFNQQPPRDHKNKSQTGVLN